MLPNRALSAFFFAAARGSVREIDKEGHRRSTRLLEGERLRQEQDCLRQTRDPSIPRHDRQAHSKHNALELVSASVRRREHAKRAKRSILQPKTTTRIYTDLEFCSSSSLCKQNSRNPVKHQSSFGCRAYTMSNDVSYGTTICGINE